MEGGHHGSYYLTLIDHLQCTVYTSIQLIAVSCEMLKHYLVLIPTKPCYIFRNWSSYMWQVYGNAVTINL